MVEKDIYVKLKKYNNVASWAIWSDPEEGKPASKTEDLSMFKEPNITQKLNTDYIFIGLNAAERKREDIKTEEWNAFHCGGNKQRDYKLRYALKDSVYWGSYITDVIKEYPKTNSKDVMAAYKKDPKYRDKAIVDLNDELKIIGGTPILIALGNNAYKVLSDIKEYLPKDIVIIKGIHYSVQWGKEKYKTTFSERLKTEGLPELKQE